MGRDLEIWEINFGFKEGGSLSARKIQQLEEKLINAKDKIMSKQKVKREDLKKIEKHVMSKYMEKRKCTSGQRKNG